MSTSLTRRNFGKQLLTGLGAAAMAPAAMAPVLPLRLAIIGFQHNHILAFVDAIKARPDVQIVAACCAREVLSGAVESL